jgi:hypothetical protein
MKRLFAFCGLLVAIPIASADVCHTPAVLHQVQAIQAVPFLLPAYGASYTGVEAADAQSTNDLLRQLLEEIRALRSESKGLGPSVASVAVDPKPVLVKNCASCHTDGKLKNTEFVMFNAEGNLRKFSGPDKKEMFAKVEKNVMPSKGKLSEADKATILSAFSK